MNKMANLNFPGLNKNNYQKKVDYIFNDISKGNSGAGFEQKSEERF